MGITRTVTTQVYCDVCGKWVIGWESEETGVSREWAKYHARCKGCTAGQKVICKECQTPQEVYDRYLQITGYCKCCVDCNFIDQKGADELMCLAAYLAGNEQARAEAQQKAGKKA